MLRALVAARANLEERMTTSLVDQCLLKECTPFSVVRARALPLQWSSTLVRTGRQNELRRRTKACLFNGEAEAWGFLGVWCLLVFVCPVG